MISDPESLHTHPSWMLMQFKWMPECFRHASDILENEMKNQNLASAWRQPSNGCEFKQSLSCTAGRESGFRRLLLLLPAAYFQDSLLEAAVFVKDRHSHRNGFFCRFLNSSLKNRLSSRISLLFWWICFPHDPIGMNSVLQPSGYRLVMGTDTLGSNHLAAWVVFFF